MKRFKSLVMAAFAMLLGAAYVLPALPASAVSSAALSITPKKNYVIEPGKSVKDKLVISNLDNHSPLTLTLRVVDFTFTDDSGTPKLFLDESTPQTTWSLRPFITVPKNVTIEPGSSKTLDMSIAIPAGHGAGSYYSAIVYSSGAPGAGGNVGLSASGTTLVFTQIPGKVNEDLKLQKFGAYQMATATKKADYEFITGDEPSVIAYTLKNSGNVTEAPVGSITLKDLFGGTRTIDKLNPTNSLALIGQTRTFTSCIKLKTQDIKLGGTTTPATTCDSPGLWPGYYSAKLDLFYGQNGNTTQEIVGSASFWYLPIWFIVLMLILLAVIGYAVWRLVQLVRRKLYGTSYKKSSLRRK